MVIDRTYLSFPNKLVIIGFGSIGQASLPLILRHIQIPPHHVTILTKKEDGKKIAAEYGVNFEKICLLPENYQQILKKYLSRGDFLLNLSVDVSSLEVVKFCRQIGALYLDTCIEPWVGGYTDPSLSIALRTNYALREAVLNLKTEEKQPTAIITHGANPGLVSYFVKQALINLANDEGLQPSPKTKHDWAQLSNQLGIKVIHIAERDTQVTNKPKRPGEFVNTWSVDGFISEGSQPAELGWGSHERYFPPDAEHHSFGRKSSIFLNRPGAATRVRTWTPLAGSFHGFLITHAESISISDYFTYQNDDEFYRPTVHYAYHPCEDAVLSLHELAGREWQMQNKHRLLFDDIIDGTDELGVLLMGAKKGAYWYGSQLSIHEARELVPHNNATTLQVAASVLAGMIWAIENPENGITEPDEIDYNFILKIASPYLGKVIGHYTEWTPINERERLFSEPIDKTDPWQFINIRVN